MIRNLSKYARRVALGAMAALALIAGSANLNPAQAACGVERDAAAGIVLGGSAAAIALAGDGLETTLIGTTVTSGFAGPALGIIAFGLFNNYCTTGSMFKAAPVTFVQVESGAGYVVAAADMSKITPEPKFGAIATDLRAVQNAALVASFAQAMSGSQYASVR